MKKEGLIVKSNQVIEAGYELTTSEQRLILSAIEQIPKGVHVSSKTIYQVNASDFVRLFGVHEKTAYRDLKEAAGKLYERSIVIRTKEKTTRIRWLQMLEVKNPYFEDVIRDSEWQSVLVMFSEAVTPLLSDLKSEFTKYLASDLKGLSSSYAIRFYELIKQYESIGSREIAIIDLRFMLCLQDKYPLFGNLQQRIIDPAIKEINEKTPMQVQYEFRKTGRKVTHIKLKFKEKPKQAQIATETLKATSDSLNTIKPLTEPQIAKYSMILCKLGSISDLAGTMDYPTFANWLGNILREPKNSNQETVKRVFKTLRTETDYNSKT